MRLFKFLLILWVLLGGTVGCHLFGFASPGGDGSKINNIQSLSADNETETQVQVEGTVANVAPFLDSGAYELTDESGSIWVVTQQNLPSLGEKVLIEGQLKYRSIPVEEQELGEHYIIEMNREERSD